MASITEIAQAAAVTSNTASTLISGGGYSWWMIQDPIERDGNTYFGYVATPGGDQYVVERNDITGALSQFQLTHGVYSMDDHNGVAINFLSDGRLIVFYTGHSQDSVMRYRISTDEHIQNLGAEQTHSTLHPSTYAQIIVYGNEVLVFYRDPTSAWSYIRSTDSGATWSAEKPFLAAPEQFYILARLLSSGDHIRVPGYRHPTLNPTLRVVDIDLTNPVHPVTSNDVALGNLDGTAASNGATLPLQESEMSLLYAPASNRSIRLLDFDNSGDAILIAEFDKSSGANAVYKLMRRTGTNPHLASNWTMSTLLQNAGIPFWADSFYFSGMSFAHEDHTGHRIFVGSNSGSSTPWKIEQWDSPNWTTWTKTILASSTTSKLMRPLSPVNASTALPVIWLDGSYNIYTDFNTSIKGYVSQSGPYAFINPEAASYVAAMAVQPTDARKAIIDTFFTSLKSNGILSKLDAGYLLASHDAQAAGLNFVNPATYSLTTGGAPTFTADSKYDGNGTTDYLNTHFKPSTAGDNFTQSNHSFGVWIIDNTGGSLVDIGNVDNSINARNATNNYGFRSANTIVATVGSGVTNSAGLTMVNRTGGSSAAIYKNGAQAGSVNMSASPLASSDVYLLARNSAGAISFSDRGLGFAFLGGGLTSAQITALYNAVRAYLGAVGAI
jgi:hypothetical protein